MNIPSFLLPANGVQTPESIARRRQMAQAMMGQGMDASPIASPWQGAARMAQALVGGLQMRRADQQDAAGRQSASDALLKALQGGDANTVAALNNPFMSGPGTQMVGDAYQRAHQPAPPPELKDLGNGQFYQFDPNNPQGGQTFTPPGYVAPAPAEPPPTSDMREYAAAKAQGFPGSLQDWILQSKKAGAPSVNVNGDQRLTEGQSKDIGFYARGVTANVDLNAAENALLSLPETMGGGLPIAGNYLKSPAYRKAERAGREVLAVILRKDTGAAVTPQEFDVYGKMYLPMPGDDAGQVQDKRMARENALRAIKLGAGTARPLFDQVDKELGSQTAPTDNGAGQSGGVPSGVDPSLWEMMTPEEKQLWAQ